MGMKAQDERPNLPEMPPYRLGRHWNTIQACLIPGIEDDIGELGEEMKKFMGICELLIDDKSPPADFPRSGCPGFIS